MLKKLTDLGPFAHVKPKISDEGTKSTGFLWLHQDIAGLQVEVDEALAVGSVDGICDISHRFHFVSKEQSLSDLAEGLSPHELHGDVGLAVEFTHLVDLAHIGVLHPCLGPGFPQDHLTVSQEIISQEFQCDGALKDLILGTVDPGRSPNRKKRKIRESV